MMLLPIMPLLPAEIFTQSPPLELVFSYSDGPEQQVHNNFRERNEALVRAGKTWSRAQLQAAEAKMGWTWGWSVSSATGDRFLCNIGTGHVLTIPLSRLDTMIWS